MGNQKKNHSKDKKKSEPKKKQSDTKNQRKIKKEVDQVKGRKNPLFETDSAEVRPHQTQQGEPLLLNNNYDEATLLVDES